MKEEVIKQSEGGPVIEDEMETIHLTINDKDYLIFIADTPELREKGLQGVTSLPSNEGMLFIFEEPQTVEFWMKDKLIPLDIIYIDEYGEVLKVYCGEPFEESLVACENTLYVLELNCGSNIKEGDELDLGELGVKDVEDWEESEKEEEKPVVMSVLDPKGESQMELKGGERIFSRPNTKTLVSLAKRAYKSKQEKDYKALGRRVFKYLHIQDHKKDDYVSLPDK